MMNRAFSLVELAIVLVILGLLTGGILAGQSLIKAAEQRSITTDVTRIATATRAFRDKYFVVPGDMANATSFWGAVGGDNSDNYTVTCSTTASTDQRTCNGDGTGLVWYQVASNSYEVGRFWQHLANAGLIEGQYSGIVSTITIGTSVLGSRVSSQHYWNATQSLAGTSTITGGDATTFRLQRLGTLALARLNANSTVADSQPVRPELAWNIDTKMDDGKPGTGRIGSFKGTAENPCSTRANLAYDAILDPAADYNLNSTISSCLLQFFGVTVAF